MAEYKDIAPLKKQIADFKKAMNSQNSDYLTGYLCALSVTEGIIATLPTADVVPIADVDKLEYTLSGVMHSVDKWLDGEELEQDEVNRAITMREKTLRIVEGLQEEIEGCKAELESEHLSRMDNIHELRAELANAKREVAKEILDEIDQTIELICAMTGVDVVLFGRYAELKKKYTEAANENKNL